MKRIILLSILLIILGCKKSNAQFSDGNSIRTTAKSNENNIVIPINSDTKIIFTDKIQNYWKKPKIIINKDTLSIKGWDDDWGSELDIKISPNKKYIIIDAIITDMPSSENALNTSENYTCRLISIERTMVIDSFQSNCDGEWNSNNQWVSDDEVFFSEQSTLTKYINEKCENSRFSIRIDDNRYEILDKEKIISKGIVKINRTENPNIISLGKIEGAFYKDSIVIQNYGNSKNEYIHFVQCDSKYLTFVRK